MNVAALAVLLAASVVRGQEAAPAFDAPGTESVWYGWQPLLGDAAAVGLVSLGLRGQSKAATLAGLGVFALASPMIHASHGSEWRAAVSLGLRVGLPLGGALLGLALDSNCGQEEEFCGLAGFALGGLAGTVTAVLLDDGVLSWEEKPLPRTFLRRLSPALALKGNQRFFALRGTF
jgi:hypothetical protein